MNANERELILKDEVYQYKEDPIMEANDANQENLLASIRVHSRLITFAVDYRRDNYNGLGARMF